MRAQGRVKIIINTLRLNKNISDHFFEGITLNKSAEALLNKDFEDYWLENYDLRLGQALINYDLIPDGNIWNREEVNWLLDNGYFDVEDICFWGRNYDKEGNKLPKVEFILLRDLTLDHIIAIKKFLKGRLRSINKDHLKYFNKRIKEKI